MQRVKWSEEKSKRGSTKRHQGRLRQIWVQEAAQQWPIKQKLATEAEPVSAKSLVKATPKLDLISTKHQLEQSVLIIAADIKLRIIVAEQRRPM